MKIVVAADSFKGAVSSALVNDAIAQGIRDIAPELEVITHPLGDGGEGTLEVLLGSGATLHQAWVSNSWGERIEAQYAVIADQVFIESAQAFGFLEGATPAQAVSASSRGVGELILVALGHKPREIFLTVGGTSGTDAGLGMLSALGVRFLDNSGRALSGGGDVLSEVVEIDHSGLDPRLAGITLTVLTDVHNPLVGERGAARVFAPQKGADDATVSTLEAGIDHFSKLLDPALSHTPGTGAGGGLAYGAMAVLGASRKSGADALMQITGFDKSLQGAQYVITGEGSFDDQSMEGKITGAVIKSAWTESIHAIVVCGVSRASDLPGLWVIELSAGQASIQESITNTQSLLVEAGRSIARTVVNS
jgi:glycerate 2-kinase